MAILRLLPIWKVSAMGTLEKSLGIVSVLCVLNIIMLYVIPYLAIYLEFLCATNVFSIYEIVISNMVTLPRINFFLLDERFCIFLNIALKLTLLT